MTEENTEYLADFGFKLWILQRQPDAEAEKVFGMTGLCRSAFPGIDGEEGKDTVES